MHNSQTIDNSTQIKTVNANSSQKPKSFPGTVTKLSVLQAHPSTSFRKFLFPDSSVSGLHVHLCRRGCGTAHRAGQEACRASVSAALSGARLSAAAPS